jgi:hypothetical protein
MDTRYAICDAHAFAGVPRPVPPRLLRQLTWRVGDRVRKQREGAASVPCFECERTRTFNSTITLFIIGKHTSRGSHPLPAGARALFVAILARQRPPPPPGKGDDCTARTVDIEVG